MGADKNQFMKAVIEAEKYDGPSIIIAYSPCINHGLKKGMGKAQENIKDAVDAGILAPVQVQSGSEEGRKESVYP